MTAIITVHSPEQIGTVVRLADEIWRDHYIPIIGVAQVDYMLEHFQSEAAIAQQINQGLSYLLITLSGEACGYAAVTIDDGHAAFLSKIYVRAAMRGRGLGATLLDHIEATCAVGAAQTLWLTVNRHNGDSIAWYERRGFTKTAELVQDIGNGFVMDDYRMEKQLSEGIPDLGE
jgi:ribosomal protein S18 acetylase RimI-like enzyme